jgi:micrococcal nuclease
MISIMAPVYLPLASVRPVRWATVALICALVAPIPAVAHAATVLPDAAPVTEDGVVRYISDGDTFHVTVKNRDVNVRLLGVTTPETKTPCTEGGAESSSQVGSTENSSSKNSSSKNSSSQCIDGLTVHCGGPQAALFAHKVLDGRAITLVPDPGQGSVDRYGRALRYIRVPGLGDYSLEVVRAGWARVNTDRPRVSEYDQLEQAQAVAVATKHGLWGVCSNPSSGD